MEKKTAAEPIPISTQNSLSSSHDPGWNDPPTWAYSQSPNSSTTPTKRILNKRIAFPLGSTNVSQPCNFDTNPPQTPPLASMPPPATVAPTLTIAPHNAVIAPTQAVKPSTSKNVADIGKEQAMIDTLENFENVITEDAELTSKRDDVWRRLNVMKTAWMEDKLDDNICQKVLELSDALRRQDVETADKIHISLMMDHTAVCSVWIAGIRHLILATRGKQIQPNLSSEETLSPYLLPCTDSSTLPVERRDQGRTFVEVFQNRKSFIGSSTCEPSDGSFLLADRYIHEYAPNLKTLSAYSGTVLHCFSKWRMKRLDHCR